MRAEALALSEGSPRRPLPRDVKALGTVSLLNDTASEMVVPLLPAFLDQVLHAGAQSLGIIEGLAETTASLLKYACGRWSDRLRRRKALALAGYGLSVAVRPLIGLSQAVWHVVGFRFADRVGKGVRTAPRDALLAQSVVPGDRGRAFGLQRAMDHAGAVVGPFVAWALLSCAGLPLRWVFLASVVPGIAVVAVLWLGVRERDSAGGGAVDGTEPARASPSRVALLADRRLAGYLLAVALFTLGNSADTFLVLRALELGVAPALGPILWVVLHVSRSAWALPGGMLADRFGRPRLILAGWAVYAAAYCGFAAATAGWMMWPLFVLYGFHAGLTEGAERALVADLVGPEVRGRAFGAFHLAVGIGALPASLLAGFLWQRAGAPVALGVGAAFAGLASLTLALWPGLLRGRPAAHGGVG
jgi:MFS family permease